VSDEAKVEMEKRNRENDEPDFVQPHKLLFSWALAANINTDRYTITLGILRGENVHARKQEKGEKRFDYIYYLNDLLERYMVHLNLLWANTPAQLQQPHIASDYLHMKAFALDPLRERMRTLVASRGSDLRATPPQVKVLFPPKLFFLLCADLKTRAACTPATISIPFEEACELDFLFTPTMDDLSVDGTHHPHFGHQLTMRWHTQTFDDCDASDPHPVDREVMIPRALRWRVAGVVVLRFNRRSNNLSVQCCWVGEHKRASGVGAGDEWVLGV